MHSNRGRTRAVSEMSRGLAFGGEVPGGVVASEGIFGMSRAIDDLPSPVPVAPLCDRGPRGGQGKLLRIHLRYNRFPDGRQSICPSTPGASNRQDAPAAARGGPKPKEFAGRNHKCDERDIYSEGGCPQTPTPHHPARDLGPTLARGLPLGDPVENPPKTNLGDQLCEWMHMRALPMGAGVGRVWRTLSPSGRNPRVSLRWRGPRAQRVERLKPPHY